MATDIVLRATVEQIAGYRARALENYDQAMTFIKLANDAAAKSCNTGTYPPALRITSGYSSSETSRKCYQQELDRAIWRDLMKSTQLCNLMDETAKEEFERGLEKDPPVATIENILATFMQKLGEADLIFRRGLVETFKRLDHKHYKTNSAFKINDKAVISCAVKWNGYNGGGWFSMNHWLRSGDELRDIERVFCVLDGAPQPEPTGGILSLISTAMHNKKQEVENAYFAVKWFKNGNMHVTFKRPDLLRKANKLIAEHYGETVPDARRAA